MSEKKQRSLAAIRQDFITQWMPTDGSYHDFEIALDHLIYAAFALAQEPFIRELNSFKDLAIKQTNVSLTQPIIKVANYSGRGKLSEKSDEGLIAEWKFWNDKIKNATSWGAAIGAALEFKKYTETALRLRGLEIPND